MTETIGARDLMVTFSELHAREPDVNQWTEERLAHHAPGLYRLLQLQALFRAFEIPWDPRGFPEGLFIERNSARYASVVDVIRLDLAKQGLPDATSDHQLSGCFEILFRYRRRLTGALSTGILAASGAYLFAHLKTRQLTEIVEQHMRIIDDVLVTFISPEGRVFALGDLVQNYGYPDVDLFELDIDSMWG